MRSVLLRAALSLRFVMLVAVVGATVGACLMFWEGGAEIWTAVSHLGSSEHKSVVAGVMEATDKFLFGVILVIFAFSITFGFVFELSQDELKALPDWMRLSGIKELKYIFFEVILVYLVVDYVTDIAESEDHAHWESLIMPAAILLLAAALRLLNAGHQET